VLITPVDHPAVSSSVIRSLIERWRGGHKLIQPEFAGTGGHPVLVDLSYRDELTTLDDQSGLRGFFFNHRPEVLRLPVESPFVAQDMDTWDDYLRVHLAVFGRKPAKVEPPGDANE
jgi:CTP:molybdopterin cytidylyltransferase MocA